MAQQITGEIIAANIQRYAQNPTALYRIMLQVMEQNSDGKYFLVDPSSPFAFLQEMSAMMTSAQVIEARAIARQMYPSLAESFDELERHMSDKDHIGRFSTPAKATIDIWLLYDEVINKAVPMTDDPAGVRKLTIARNTRITAGGYPFTFQYPIDIIVKPSGGVMVVYDNTKESPFKRLDTNKVEWTVVQGQGKKYLVLRVLAWQMSCSTEIETLNAVTGFSKAYNFTDSYYYTRAFVKNVDTGLWDEIKTTHSDQVFDPNDPTVTLRVDTVNKRINVKVPQIYFNNGKITTQLRIDVYTTSGKIDLSLRNFDPSAYTAKWIDLDDPAGSIFRAPMDTFSDIKIRSDDVITGGANALSFEELRTKVITNALDTPLIPLSLGGLETALEELGFRMVLNVDNITDREILATRLLPTPATNVTGSGVGVTVGTVLTKLSDWQLNDGIADNGIRMTIKPSALFDLKDGVVKLVPSDTVDSLKALASSAADQLALTVNQNDYAFTPFFYVLDVQNETFSIRPYRLDRPLLKTHFFTKENIQAGAGVSTVKSLVEFASTGDGWEIRAQVDGNGLWGAFDMEDTFAQLSYVDTTTGVRFVVNGVQEQAIDPETGRPVDLQYVYRFKLESDFDIDADHHLRFKAAGLVELEHEFDLVFFVKNWQPTEVPNTEIDQLINPLTVPGHSSGDVYLGLTHETMTIHLGDYLENLWRRSRSIVGESEYVLNPGPTTYKHYPETLYVLDLLTGNIAVEWNETTEELETEVLHYAGDPILITPITLTDTEAASVSDTEISFTTSTPILAPATRYAFTLWGAGVDGKTLVGTCVAGPTAGTVTLSVPIETAISAGAKFVYGEQEILAEEGQPALDAGGNLIPVGARPLGMKREFDILLMDGRYYFTNEEQSNADKVEAVDFMTSWLEEELEDIANRVIERTNLFFFPTITMGKIPATEAGEQITIVDAEQNLSVVYYMPADRYNNEDLRAALETSTAVTIANTLANRTVSRPLIERALLDAAAGDVVSVELVGFNNQKSQTLTFHDPMTRPTLAKRLALTAAGLLQVVETVDVRFERYTE